MTSPAVELQDMVLRLLRDSADVGALVADRVYDKKPDDAEYPHVTFGPSDFVPDDDIACIYGREETLQLDVWSRDSGRLWPCREIVDAVCAALHDVNDNLATHQLTSISARGRVVDDPDGITAHGIVTITATIDHAP